MSWSWSPRPEPLTPCGCTAAGPVALLLARRLLQAPRSLSGVRAGDRLVLLGDDLPWVDGVLYLGRESPLDPVLLPTHLAPDWPASWIGEVLRRRSRAPWAVLPQGVIGLSQASRVEPELLEEFLRAQTPS